jgi:hypothetical protein
MNDTLERLNCAPALSKGKAVTIMHWSRVHAGFCIWTWVLFTTFCHDMNFIASIDVNLSKRLEGGNYE